MVGVQTLWGQNRVLLGQANSEPASESSDPAGAEGKDAVLAHFLPASPNGVSLSKMPGVTEVGEREGTWGML